MSSDGKEKAQGVAVVDLLRPAGLFCFAMLFAKMRGIHTQITTHALKNTLV